MFGSHNLLDLATVKAVLRQQLPRIHLVIHAIAMSYIVLRFCYSLEKILQFSVVSSTKLRGNKKATVSLLFTMISRAGCQAD